MSELIYNWKLDYTITMYIIIEYSAENYIGMIQCKSNPAISLDFLKGSPG